MDPVSQAAVGAVFAGAVANKDNMRRYLAVGALSGMAADLDIMIHSAKDPLLNLELHRHFTHSLIFIPVGALICAYILSFFFRVNWKSLYLPALLGYMTAAPLDALTSYGTHLLWPFTDERTAFNIVSVLDPLYTVTLLVFLAICFFRNSKQLIYLSLIFISFYHCLGFMQRYRAEDMLLNAALEQKIEIQRIWTQPSLGNLLLWRGVIETADEYYVYGIHVGIDNKISTPNRCKRYFLEKDSGVKKGSVLEKDIKRFSFFSNQFVARDQENNQYLSDIRYSRLPWTLNPLWAIVIDENHPNTHVRLKFFRDIESLDTDLFFNSIIGQGIFEKN